MGRRKMDATPGQAFELRQQGKTTARIAEELGAHPTTINRWLKNENAEMDNKNGEKEKPPAMRTDGEKMGETEIGQPCEACQSEKVISETLASLANDLKASKSVPLSSVLHMMEDTLRSRLKGYNIIRSSDISI